MPKKLQVYIDDDDAAELQRLAIENGTSVSTLLKLLLTSALRGNYRMQAAVLQQPISPALPRRGAR